MRSKLLVCAVALGISSIAYAKPYKTQKEFDEVVSVYQMLIENRQAKFEQLLDNPTSIDDVLDQACLFSGTWKRLSEIGKENMHFKDASFVYRESLKISNQFDQFFVEFGTTYNQRCK